MPDEITTSADNTTPAPVEPVVAEPTIASELEPIAVVEPAVVAVPTEPVVEIAVEPIIVAEQLVVAENPIAIETAPAIDAIAEPVVVEPVTAVEQPAPIVESPAVLQRGDLGLTPQMEPFEALKQETLPAIQAEASPPESARMPIVETVSPAEPIKTISNFIRKLLPEANFAIQARRRKKLDRIMGLFAKKAQNGSTVLLNSPQASSPQVTNDDVEKLLHISDATASRYLGILEKEGKVKQVGTAGRWVSYTKV